MTSSNSIFDVIFNRFCQDKIFTTDTQFKDFIDTIKLREFLVAVHTPTELMYDVMMTSNNCYITVIFQSFQNTFIKMHQNVNINTFI